MRGSNPTVAGIFAASLDDPRPRRVGDSPGLAAFSSGHLLFVRDKTLVAQPFDTGRLTLSGEPVPLAEGVSAEPESGVTGFAPFSVSAAGILTYRVVGAPKTRLTWINRAGQASGTIGEAGRYSEPWLFPDGKRLAIASEDLKTSNADIWIVDMARAAFSRLTFETSSESSPVVSPDGAWLAYSSARVGNEDIYRRPASGAGAEEVALKTNEAKFLDAWTADGRYLVYEAVSVKTRLDIWALPLFGDKKPFPVIQTPFNDVHSSVSADGRWIAYASDETGRGEVYVQAFPGGGGRWQVSTEGGDQPRWRQDGRELYFVTLDGKLMAVDVRAGSPFEAGTPKALFELKAPPNGLSDFRNQYAPDPSGQRFLVTRLVEEPNPEPIRVITSWAADGKKCGT